MIRNEELENFLTACGVTWRELPRERHLCLGNDWGAVYADCFACYVRYKHVRYKQGAKAQDEYARQSARAFVIVPFLGDTAGPQSIGKRGPRKTAYECEGDGGLPDLSAFAGMDFFIAPVDLAWTMVHTHEDYELGGPYFLRKDWIMPPTRKRGW